ncbi:MAG: tetratricopeptide repeat protein [Gammaproteobacteria bacterium]|nr:tetratricopeptide repeat protein [Gammaproteobacteria bacterium]
MKFSGDSKAIFLLGAFLVAPSTIFAQPLAADSQAAVTDVESTVEQAPSSSQLLYFERPVALDAQGEVSAVEMLAPDEKTPATETSVFVDLTPQQQEYLQRLQDIDNYEQMLEQLEYDGGAWSAQIAEELSTLGNLLYAQGDYEESIEVFDRAVHVNRVNYGLYSTQQIPLLERMVESHIALGQWQEADQQQQYAFYVQNKAYGARDPRMVEVFENLARWNITSFFRGIDPDPSARLLETYLLFRAAANTVAFHFGTADPRYVSLLRDVAGASDMMTRYTPPGTVTATPTNPNIRRVSEFVGVPNDQVRVPNGGGEGALRKILEFYSDDDRPVTRENLLLRVRALTELGDWYMMEQTRQAALDAYTDAWNLLLTMEDGRVLAKQYFDQIVFLPTFSRFDDERREAFQVSPDFGARQGYVDISFDVSRYGHASNFTVLAVEPAGMGRVDMMAINHLRSLTVRPRVEEGETLATTGERYRMPFWYREIPVPAEVAAE